MTKKKKAPKLRESNWDDITKRYRETILAYLSNPEMPFPIRSKYGDIIGKTRKTVYDHFSVNDLLELETEAYNNRKNSCVRQRANVLKALYDRAIGSHHAENHISFYEGDITITPQIKRYPPDKAAAQEFLDRTEGKVKDVSDLNVIVTDRVFKLVEKDQTDIRDKKD